MLHRVDTGLRICQNFESRRWALDLDFVATHGTDGNA